MTVFSWLWIAWGVLFMIIEGVAIVRKERGDTLSELVWAWFQLRGRKDDKKPWQVILRIVFMAFWCWLTVHFLFGGSFV